ncbi:hypothetical protein J4231_00630 [Candidatus Woesearchaeota archaeon]|nr:hypothetical protein [Candidatus Woesearchaeota archaeon]
MRKGILMASVAMAIAAFASIAYADLGFGGCNMGGMMYGNYGPSALIFGWLNYVLIIALVVAAIYWLVKSAKKR